MQNKHFFDSRIIMTTRVADDGSVVARLLIDDLELDVYYFPEMKFWSANTHDQKKGWEHLGNMVVDGDGMNSFKKFVVDNYTVDETLVLGDEDNPVKQLTSELGDIAEEFIAAMYGRLIISADS